METLKPTKHSDAGTLEQTSLPRAQLKKFIWESESFFVALLETKGLGFQA